MVFALREMGKSRTLAYQALRAPINQYFFQSPLSCVLDGPVLEVFIESS
jgi:hypothetical protein